MKLTSAQFKRLIAKVVQGKKDAWDELYDYRAIQPLNLDETIHVLTLTEKILAQEYDDKDHVLCLRALVVPDDRALELYLEASKLGNIDAMYQLARMYKQRSDDINAFKWFNDVIALGHVEAINDLAMWYQDKGKDAKAIKFFNKAIIKGNVDAMNNLAMIYEAQSDFATCIDLYTRASEGGCANASLRLAEINEDGLCDQSINIPQAMFFYKTAIQQYRKELAFSPILFATALYQYARLCEQNSDEETAASHYDEAIRYGHTGAMVDRAMMYSRLNDDSNSRQAKALLTQASELGDLDAKFNLAVIHDESFVDINIEAATKYLELIAVLKQSPKIDNILLAAALNNCAIIFEECHQEKHALAYYKEAADLGDKDAALSLKNFQAQLEKAKKRKPQENAATASEPSVLVRSKRHRIDAAPFPLQPLDNLNPSMAIAADIGLFGKTRKKAITPPQQEVDHMQLHY